MPDSIRTTLLVILLLAGSVWLGGYVAIAAVARTAARTLEPAQRVAFFRALGRSYLKIGVPALVLAYASGAILLWGHAWDGALSATVATAVLLAMALGVAVRQARRMTRLRASVVDGAVDALKAKVHRGSRSAGLLRSVIGVLSLILLILGAILAT